MTDDGKLGVGVVGLGLVAAEHIKAYRMQPRCEIAFAADQSAANGGAVRLPL